ncbi:MAG: hypothetical protein NUV67_03500, partial [archaeon]|nr:hypothetical protein [archaeon]
GTNFADVREARSKSDLANDMIFRWVEENIPRQYANFEDIALAFNRLSRADIFNGRIYRRQHWGFLRYSSALAAEGVAFSKGKVSHDFVMYQFPMLLSMLSKSSSERAMRAGLGKKIGDLTHSSSRSVVSKDLPYLRMLFADKKKAVELSALFGLGEKEIAFMLGAKPGSKKSGSIFSESEKLRALHAKPKRVFYEEPVLEEEEPIEEDEPPGPEALEPVDGHKQTRLF